MYDASIISLLLPFDGETTDFKIKICASVFNVRLQIDRFFPIVSDFSQNE
jgi:hypothetical protein